MKTRYLIPQTLLSILLLAGCGGSGEDHASNSYTLKGDSNSEPASRGIIGVSLLTLDNPFFKVIGDNITAEGKKHGYETIVVSGDKDVANQHPLLCYSIS